MVALTSAGGQTQASYTYEPFGTDITGVKPGAAAQKLSAVLECVDVSGSGFTAHFGYLNPNTYSVSIPVGTNNRFTPAPQDRGQTTVFLPGRKRDVFTVSVPTGTVLVWTLNGKTSTASGSSARCSAPASPESPFRFAGEQLDPATQLYNLRARQYSPGVGRFLSTDPLQADPAVSSYAYAGNDPTTFVDPSGLGAVWGNPCTSFRCLLKGVLKLAGWHSGCERSRLCLGLFAANVIPFVGGDVWLARAAEKAAVEVSDATVLVRGGTNTVDRIAGGSGVWIDAAGKAHGVSVNAGRTVEEGAQGIPNGQVGVTTVGHVRQASGYVRPDPLPGNPRHCLIGGLPVDVISNLLTPTIRNPCL